MTGRALRMLSLDLGHRLVTAPTIERCARRHPVRLMTLEARSGVRGTVSLLMTIEAYRRNALEQMRHVASRAALVLVRW